MGDYFIYIIIAIGILSFIVRIINSANKRKRDAEAKRQAQQEGPQAAAPPPPRQAPMSDIQKAFMMMMGEEEVPEAPPAPRPVPRPASPYTAPAKSKAVSMEGYGSHEGRVSHEGRAGKREGVGSHEGRAGKNEGHEFHPPGFHTMPNKYSSVDLNKIKASREDVADENYKIQSKGKRKKSPLKLFENKDDYFKAVVYSEILNRRAR